MAVSSLELDKIQQWCRTGALGWDCPEPGVLLTYFFCFVLFGTEKSGENGQLPGRNQSMVIHNKKLSRGSSHCGSGV